MTSSWHFPLSSSHTGETVFDPQKLLLLWPFSSHTAKSRQSRLTLCNPIDGSPPGSPVPGIPQARTLEWVAISSSNAWKWKVKVKSLSRVRLCATPQTAAYQAPPPMGFSSKNTGAGCHCLPCFLSQKRIVCSYYVWTPFLFCYFKSSRPCGDLSKILKRFSSKGFPFESFHIWWDIALETQTEGESRHTCSYFV